MSSRPKTETPPPFYCRHIVPLTRLICCIVVYGTYNLSSGLDLLAPAFVLSLGLLFHEYHRRKETKPRELFEDASKQVTTLYWCIYIMFSVVLHYDRLLNLN